MYSPALFQCVSFHQIKFEFSCDILLFKGFDEGPVFPESYEHLQRSGIEVTRGILSDEANEVLQSYAKKGLIYNRQSIIFKMGFATNN